MSRFVPIILLALACTPAPRTSTSSTGLPSCAPGESFLCWCSDGAQGTQWCNSDGKSLGPCSCEPSATDAVSGEGIAAPPDTMEDDDTLPQEDTAPSVDLPTNDKDAGNCNGNCLGKECGDDGCGQSCGECGGGLFCNQGKCSTEMCVADCAGKNCGSDGCNDTCGLCGASQACANGVCVASSSAVDWDQEMRLTATYSLLDHLPEGPDTGIQTGFALLTSPHESVLVTACALSDQLTPALKSLCSAMFQNPAVACGTGCMTGHGLTVSAVIEGTWATVLFTSNLSISQLAMSLSETFGGVRLQTRLSFDAPPPQAGSIGPPLTTATLETVSYTFQGDTHQFSAADFTQEVLSGEFTAVTGGAGGSQTIALSNLSHPFPFGRLFKFLLEDRILPELAGPQIDSISELVNVLLGGASCGDVSACCEAFVANVASVPLSEAQLFSACLELSATVAGQLNVQLTDPMWTGGAMLSLKAETPCTAADTNFDDSLDVWGSEAAPCSLQATTTAANVQKVTTIPFYGEAP